MQEDMSYGRGQEEVKGNKGTHLTFQKKENINKKGHFERYSPKIK